MLCRRSSPSPAAIPLAIVTRLLSIPPLAKIPGVAGAVSALRRTWPGIEVTADASAGSATDSSKRPAALSIDQDAAVSGSGRPGRGSPSRSAAAGRSGSASLRAAMGLPSSTATDCEVTLYSLPSCGVCRAAREYMQHQGIAFKERDVQSDSAAAAEVQRLNPRRSVPTFDLGGRETLVGFTPQEFEQALLRVRASLVAAP